MNIQAEELKEFSFEILKKVVPEEEATIIADTLLDAELTGVVSHGVSRLHDYIKRFDKGLIEGKTKLDKINETLTSSLYDANNGWGQVASVFAVEEAVKKAQEYGTGFVGISNSNHNGTSAYYTKLIAEKGLIGIAMTNASPLMVPFGAAEPSLGTNPLSIAIPNKDGEAPVVLDMATSNVARGKIILANKNNEAIPEGWAITKEGKPTTYAAEALEGYILPMGAKGSGLAIMVDILSGVLTGSLFGKSIPKMYGDDKPQRVGHLIGAISLDGFVRKEMFFDNLHARIKETVESKPMEGHAQVYMPGDLERQKAEYHLQHGISLSEEVSKELEELSVRFSVPFQITSNK
ncbi:Ldh family oxidoreductase [Evansella sp. AB-rgal1]|uniref:Ldh family oxidoreductase n=1 Tax=Evansella sp. AB-rgal1 TaxID=3242696 RepID=UPI00359DACFB